MSQQPIVAGFSMEVMTEPLPETAAQSISFKSKERVLELAIQRDAVALGPGLSLDPESQALARALVAELDRPMVVDADALSALAGHLDLLDGAPAPRVLTPIRARWRGARDLGREVEPIGRDRAGLLRPPPRPSRLKGAQCVGGPDGASSSTTGQPGWPGPAAATC